MSPLILVAATYFIVKTSTRLDSTNARLDAFEKHVDDRFRHVDEQFGRIDEQFRRIDAQFRRIDNQFKEVKDTMRDFQKDLLDKWGPSVIQSSSPVSLTEYGKEIADKVEAKRIASAYADKLKDEKDIDSMNSYEIQEYCFSYAKEKLLANLKSEYP